MTYQRFDDGRLKYSHDLLGQRFDRRYSYDQAGQLAAALSGAEARGEPETNYRTDRQYVIFDVWGNLTTRTGKHWSHTVFFSGVFSLLLASFFAVVSKLKCPVLLASEMSGFGFTNQISIQP